MLDIVCPSGCHYILGWWWLLPRTQRIAIRECTCLHLWLLQDFLNQEQVIVLCLVAQLCAIGSYYGLHHLHTTEIWKHGLTTSEKLHFSYSQMGSHANARNAQRRMIETSVSSQTRHAILGCLVSVNYFISASTTLVINFHQSET